MVVVMVMVVVVMKIKKWGMDAKMTTIKARTQQISHVLAGD